MSITLHTNFQFGSYESDRNTFIKQKENDVLANPSSASARILQQLRPHFDAKRSLAIGYGLDLLTNSFGAINDFLGRTGQPLLSQHDIGLIITARTIVAQTPANQPLSLQSATTLKNLAQQFTLALPNEVTAENILKLDLEQRELRLDAFLANNGLAIGQSREREALISLYFNSKPTFKNGAEIGNNLIGPNLIRALQTGNRAEAWYEIRYGTNKEKTSAPQVAKGIAARRYEESDLFGLYNGAGQPLTEAEAVDAIRMVKLHLSVPNGILDYEAKFPPTGGHAGQVFSGPLAPAYQFMINAFNSQGLTPEQVVVGISRLGGDPIQGTEGSDLALGDISHDILIGGGGNDLLVGGQGKDVYVYNSGDGQDVIFDSDQDISGNGVSDGDRQGLVVFDHQLLAGGIKKQSEGVYKSLDGQVTYQRSGSDLVVNGTLTIKEWQEGQFGIRLKDLPDDPQEPGMGGGGRDYKRIDHYEQIGVDANGQPIFVPVFVDFFDEENNISSDSALIPPIGDEHNSINALGGHDSVSTGAGNDSINGGEGNDNLNSGGGADTLDGGLERECLAAPLAMASQ